MSFRLLMYCLALMAIVTIDASAGGSGSSRSILKPCPDKPNCVSSEAPEGAAKMDPIRYKGSIEDARKTLLGIVEDSGRATVVQNDGNYLKVEFRSPILSFVDDVEFAFDDASKIINFRSASRSGYYDFGVNRRRMEDIIKKFSSK
ncbi:MAG: DUF1499 domain-containing protein [Desulfomonilaceae bacterium]